MVDCCHDDTVFHYFGRNPLAGTHHGKAACLAVLRQVGEKTNRRLVAVRDVLAGDRLGAIVGAERFERDGRAAEFERLLHYSVKDGRLSECWVHDEDQRTIDDFFA